MTAGRLSFESALVAWSLIALVLRVAYVVAQPATDPSATGALLDGAYYIQWGQALAAGSATQSGAYYLAPLYAWFLAGFFALLGDSIAWLYLLQQMMLVCTAILLALVARDLAGERAGLATALLLLLYHPALFFASRPLGEPIGLLFLALAIWLLMRASPAAWAFAGVSVALSALARPNLLLVIAAWLAWGVAARPWWPGDPADPAEVKRGRAGLALALAGVALVLLPVVLRNWRASGHLVPISTNSGLTLYHGNGPGARGIGVLPSGFSGQVATQREEATRLASARVGRPFDDVEADRWWGRQAVRARLEDPRDTLLLQLRRTALLLSTRELDLDYAPSIDRNPWRWSAPLPFALLLGLSIGALFVAGFRRSGGWLLWGAVVACAATPLLFYVSSRYRLPVAVLLAVPAGVGVAELLRARGRRRMLMLVVICSVTLFSALVPTGAVTRTARAIALANRGAAWKQLGELAHAQQDLGRALATDPACAIAHFNLGTLFAQDGRLDEAENHYRLALQYRPDLVESAHNLSGLLLLDGRTEEAISLLLQALAIRPVHSGCWKNLIVAHYLEGDMAAANRAVQRALGSGALLEPEWLAGLERKGSPEENE